MSTARVTLEILGLGAAGGGALVVERALARERGVVRAYVSPETEMAYVQYDPTVITPDGLIVTIERTGFRAGEPIPR